MWRYSCILQWVIINNQPKYGLISYHPRGSFGLVDYARFNLIIFCSIGGPNPILSLATMSCIINLLIWVLASPTTNQSGISLISSNRTTTPTGWLKHGSSYSSHAESLKPNMWIILPISLYQSNQISPGNFLLMKMPRSGESRHSPSWGRVQSEDLPPLSQWGRDMVAGVVTAEGMPPIPKWNASTVLHKRHQWLKELVFLQG